MASATEEQTEVVAEINRNLARISEISQQNSTGVTQSFSAASELAKLFSELQSMVGQFRVA